MIKIFIDCGFHHGEGLRSFIESKVIDNETIIYAFEPNPACNLINRAKIIIQQYNVLLHCIDRAVWISDGEIEFLQEDHTKSQTGSPHDGYSNIDGWGSSLKEVNSNHPGYCDSINVKCLDFSKFLQRLPKAYITCKMDIEGSEYAVLRHLINQGTISKINELYIEFHARFIEKESNESEIELIEVIQKSGVKVHWWI